jgi:hypothetical protein
MKTQNRVEEVKTKIVGANELVYCIRYVETHMQNALGFQQEVFFLKLLGQPMSLTLAATKRGME